jgi:chaperone required for assembly of F1-ATPase
MQSPASDTRKRFYETVSVAEREGGFLVELDGRQLKTPARKDLMLPTLSLGEAVAAEWSAQGKTIAIGTMPLTKLANTALDGVIGREAEIAGDITRYAASDLVCYRAPFPPELAAKQAAAWDPILAWVAEKFGASFLIAYGVGYLEQPPASIAIIGSVIASHGPFELAALHVMTSLTGSALLALAHAQRTLNSGEAWAAAHVDEDWQAGQWGEDFEAHQRRGKRFQEFEAASRFFRLAGDAPLAG